MATFEGMDLCRPEPPVTDPDYPPGDFPNWKWEGWGRAYHRDLDGRTTLWDAKVFEWEGRWWAIIWRVQGRRAQLRRAFAGDAHGANGEWRMGPFTTQCRAIAFAERWIQVRRDRATWQDPDPPIAVGDRYTLRVLDEEKALEWPARRDGLEVER